MYKPKSFFTLTLFYSDLALQNIYYFFITIIQSSKLPIITNIKLRRVQICKCYFKLYSWCVRFLWWQMLCSQTASTCLQSQKWEKRLIHLKSMFKLNQCCKKNHFHILDLRKRARPEHSWAGQNATNTIAVRAIAAGAEQNCKRNRSASSANTYSVINHKS